MIRSAPRASLRIHRLAAAGVAALAACGGTDAGGPSLEATSELATDAGTSEVSDGDRGSEAESTDSTAASSIGESSTGPDPMGPVCVDYGEPCSECEMAACPDLFCDCYGEPQCQILAACVKDCPTDDATCLSTCAAAHSDAASTAVLLADCAAVQCTDACAYLGDFVALTPCQRCTYEACGPQMNTCAAEPSCPALLLCVTACAGEIVCQTGCATLYPDGIAAAQVVGDCAVIQCEEECS